METWKIQSSFDMLLSSFQAAQDATYELCWNFCINLVTCPTNFVWFSTESPIYLKCIFFSNSVSSVVCFIHNKVTLIWADSDIFTCAQNTFPSKETNRVISGLRKICTTKSQYQLTWTGGRLLTLVRSVSSSTETTSLPTLHHIAASSINQQDQCL